ncbi:nose resistant to fluoxetine protein 6-like [Aphis craccivora]|uniref:Nose resistant to fluoxetine protein 6-like n=1 Tax=Aphis craccivora TaxID=307492 RepID=A0A6G0YAB3_APHCR|nr:nose resistant to fluoxetine protein 6-like [Aphis craccivora]
MTRGKVKTDQISVGQLRFYTLDYHQLAIKLSELKDIGSDCLYMSWHLSRNIQFFIIGVFVVYILIKTPKKGIALLGIIIGLSIFVPFIATLWTGQDGIDKISIEYVKYLNDLLNILTHAWCFRKAEIGNGIDFYAQYF